MFPSPTFQCQASHAWWKPQSILYDIFRPARPRLYKRGPFMGRTQSRTFLSRITPVPSSQFPRPRKSSSSSSTNVPPAIPFITTGLRLLRCLPLLIVHQAASSGSPNQTVEGHLVSYRAAFSHLCSASGHLFIPTWAFNTKSSIGSIAGLACCSQHCSHQRSSFILLGHRITRHNALIVNWVSNLFHSSRTSSLSYLRLSERPCASEG